MSGRTPIIRNDRGPQAVEHASQVEQAAALYRAAAARAKLPERAPTIIPTPHVAHDNGVDLAPIVPKFGGGK